MAYISRLFIQLALLVGFASCDFTSWEIASWNRPRAAFVRDSFYLEGGWMQTGTFKDDKWNDAKTVEPTEGLLLKLSMNKTFGVNLDSTPAVFESINEGPIQNYYVDGFMFADYDEFYAYGGMYLTADDTKNGRTVSCPLFDTPEGSTTQRGVPNIAYDPQGGAFSASITNGAGANAPSESLGFYFGGLYNANGTKFDYFYPPTDHWGSLVRVSTTSQSHADWAVYEVASDVPWRAEAGLVWVPTSSRGILIAIGGVVSPADLDITMRTNNTDSVRFLQEFPVYDIGSETWRIQPLNEGSPFPDGTLAQFCTVVASSADGSHHDIYLYGGWDGSGGKANGEVWILTVPSFTWIRADSSTRAGDRRQGHVCFSPYPDQMIAVGGTGDYGQPAKTNRTVDVFNLNKLDWTGSYDPAIHEEYKPHQTILDVIAATPTAANLASGVAGWFNNKYNMDRIKYYGPFESAAPTTSSTPTSSDTSTTTPESTDGSDRPWVTPVAASVSVVGGLALVGALIFFCCYRRKGGPRGHMLESGADENISNHRKSWIVPWVFATSSAVGAKHVGSDTITEVEHSATSPPMTEVHPQELEGGYFDQRSSDAGNRRDRWSSSTAVRSPRAEYSGLAEGTDTPIHEVHGSPTQPSTPPDGINYEFRNMAYHPPSIVSGGHPTTVLSGSVSGHNDSHVASSPQSISPAGPASPAMVPTIPESDALNGGGAGLFSPFGPGAFSANPQPARPIHRRNPSSVSSEGVSLPPPGLENQSGSLAGRPRGASRSVSGDHSDIVRDEHGVHTL